MGDGTEGTATGSLERDRIHELLIAEHRRYLLSCLDNHGALPLSDLADEIAYQIHDAPEDEIPEEKVNQAYDSLWHAHIPKLADANIISYDPDEDVVELAENADVAIQFMSDDVRTDY